MHILKKYFMKILPKSRFVRGVGILAGGTALAQGLAILVSPLLTRLYQPEEFGLFAIYVSILSILAVPASLCYERAIPLPEKDRPAANLLVLSLFINLAFSVLTVIVVWLWHDSIAHLVKAPELASVLFILPLGLLWIGVYQSLNYWVMRKQAYARILKTKWKQSLTMILVQVGSGIINAGTFGLVLGDVAGKAGGTGALALTTWKEDKEVFRRVTLTEMRQAASRYRSFPLFSSWSVVLNSIVLQIPILFLTTSHNPAVVGFYALAFRVLGVPLNMISGAVGQVHMAESARLVGQSPEQLENLFWKTLRTVFMIGTPLVGILAFAAPVLFSFIFGDEWKDAGTYLQIMCPMFLFDFAANSIGGSLDVLERQDFHAIREIIRIILIGLSVILAIFFSFSPLISIISLSSAGTLGYLIHLSLSWLGIRKYKLQRMADR